MSRAWEALREICCASGPEEGGRWQGPFLEVPSWSSPALSRHSLMMGQACGELGVRLTFLTWASPEAVPYQRGNRVSLGVTDSVRHQAVEC